MAMFIGLRSYLKPEDISRPSRKLAESVHSHSILRRDPDIYLKHSTHTKIGGLRTIEGMSSGPYVLESGFDAGIISVVSVDEAAQSDLGDEQDEWESGDEEAQSEFGGEDEWKSGDEDDELKSEDEGDKFDMEVYSYHLMPRPDLIVYQVKSGHPSYTLNPVERLDPSNMEQPYPLPLWFRWEDPPDHIPLMVYNNLGPRQRPKCAGLHEIFEADEDPIDPESEGSPYAPSEISRALPVADSPIPSSPSPIQERPERPAPVDEPYLNAERRSLRLLCCQCHHLSTNEFIKNFSERVRNLEFSREQFDYDEEGNDAEPTIEYERQELECEWCADHNRSHHYCLEACQLVEILYTPFDANSSLRIVSHAAYEVMEFSARFGDGCVRTPGPLFIQVGCCQCQNKFRVPWDKGEVVEMAPSAVGKPRRKAIGVNLKTILCPFCTHIVCTLCDRGTVGIRVIVGDTPGDDGIGSKTLARVNTRFREPKPKRRKL